MAGSDGTLNFDTKIDSSGFQKGINNIGGVAQKGLSATVRVLEGTAASVAALGGVAIKVGSDFEAGMSQVQAITGTVADKDLPGIIEKATEMGLSFKEGASTTETAMNILSAKAKAMGASTKFSATESAEALNYMAMAGWKTEDMLDGIEGIMNLAAASGEDLAATSDIVTDALTAFGMSASGATHFADILAAASSNANTNVGMMGETFKYVAPLAGALKYSAEDTALAIGLMANAGIKGGQAGTALRAVLTRLAKPTKESADAMGALGLSITDSSGQMRPLSDVIGDMRASFAGLTEDEQASYAAMLGGQEAMSGLLAIVNASDADFEKLSGAINDCNGTAEEMAEIMQDNLQGQLVILQSGLEGLGVSLYETMQDSSKNVVKEAQNMVQQLQDAFNEGGFEGLVHAFGGVLVQIVQQTAEAAPEMIDVAVSLVQSFCDGLKTQGIGVTGANLIGSFVDGVLSCAGEMWSIGITIFTEFLSGMSEQLPQIVETGREAVEKVGRALVENAPALLTSAGNIASFLYEGILSGLPQISTAGVKMLNQLATGISNNLPAMIPVAMQALMNFSGALRENVGHLVDAGLNLIMSLAQSLIDNIPVFIETIPTIITNIAGIINDNAPKLLMCGIELLGKLVLGLIQAIPTLIANIPQIIQAIVSVILAFNWIQLGGNIVRGLVNGIKNLASSVPTAFREFCANAHGIVNNFGWSGLGKAIIQLIKNGITSLIDLVPRSLGKIAEAALNAVKNIDWWGLGVNIIRGLASGISGSAGELMDAAGRMASGLLDSVKDFFGIHSPSTVMAEQGSYLVQGMANGIAGMPDAMTGYLNQTVMRFSAWGQQMSGIVQTSMLNMVNIIVSFMSQLPGKVWLWLVNVVTRVTQWGLQMRSGADLAMSNMIAAIIAQLCLLPGKVAVELDKVTMVMVRWGTGIISKMTDIGHNIVSGIWQGISSDWPWLEREVAKLAQSLLESAKRELGINSPSTEFRDKFGQWLMPGAVEGVKKSMPKALQEMREQAGELLAAMRGTVAASMGEISLQVSGAAGLRTLDSAGTIVYADNSMKQENNYHVPVVTPAETAKANREAFRKMAGGVK